MRALNKKIRPQVEKKLKEGIWILCEKPVCGHVNMPDTTCCIT